MHAFYSERLGVPLYTLYYSFKYCSVCPGLTWCGTPVCAPYYSAVVYDTCVLHYASMGIMLDDYNRNHSVGT